MDFLLLTYGLVFFGVFSLGIALSRIRALALPWFWLALFGILQAAGKWLQMLALSLSPALFPYLLFAALLGLSFLCLLEFARLGLRMARCRTPGRWVYLPLLALTAGGFAAGGALGGTVGARYFLGICAALGAAWLFWRLARKQAAWSRKCFLVAGGFAGYALTMPLASGPASFSPATYLNAGLFQGLPGLSVLWLRAAIMTAVMAGLWLLYWEELRKRKGLPVSWRNHRWDYCIGLAVATVLLAGWLIARWVVREHRESVLAEIQQHLAVAAVTIDQEQVAQLRWTESDRTAPAYLALKKRLLALQASTRQARFISLVGFNRGVLVFLADSEPASSPGYAPPGQPYPNGTPQLFQALALGLPFVVGPLADPWGQWMVGGQLVADLGADQGCVFLLMRYDASQWTAIEYRVRLPYNLLTIMWVLFLISFFVTWQRTLMLAAVREKDLERSRRQEAALSHLVSSNAMSSGHFSSAVAEITRTVADVLEVERVGIWLGSLEAGKLECVDQYERSLHKHTAGMTLQSQHYPRYFAAFAGSRIINAPGALADLRLAEFRESYLAPLQITSVLDVAFRMDGRMAGILCVEQGGGRRPWMPDEVRFAVEASDQVSQALLNARRKDAEQQLAASEKRYREFANMLPQVVYEVDHRGLFTYVNQAAYDLTGYTAADFARGIRPEEVVIPGDVARLRENLRQAATGRNLAGNEYTIVRKDGTLLTCVAYTSVIMSQGQVIGLRGVLVDISDRKRDELRLQKDLERFHLLYELSVNLAAAAKPDEAMQSIVEQTRRLLGVDAVLLALVDETRQALVVRAAAGLRAPALPLGHLPLHAGLGGLVLQAGAGRTVEDLAAMGPAEHLPPSLLREGLVSAMAVPIRMGENKLGVLYAFTRKLTQFDAADMHACQLVGQLVAQEITRIRMEQNLRASEARYRTIFENTGASTVIIEADATISLANHEFEQLSGYTRQEIEGHFKWTDFVHPGDLPRMLKRHQLRRENPDAVERMYEFRLKDHGGNWRDMFITVDLIPGTSQSVASMLDISKRKQTEKLLQKRLRYEEGLEAFSRVLFTGAAAQETITEALNILREACAVSRAYLHENARGPDGQWMAHLRALAGTRPGRAPESGPAHPPPMVYRETLPHFLDLLPRNQPVAGPVAQFPAAERAYFEARGIHSLLALPIFVGGEWQGVVSFSDSESRQWDEHDIRLLRVAAEILGNHLARLRAETELQNSRKQLADVIDFLPDATLVIDNDRRVIVWNRALERMTGVSAAEMIGKGNYEHAIPFYGQRRPILVDLVLEPRGDIEKQYSGLHRDGDSLFAENLMPQKGAGPQWLWGIARPLYDAAGTRIGAIESIRDITERKLTEQALKESRDELEQRVQVRTRELVDANARLQTEIAERILAQGALAESEALLSEIVTNTPGVFYRFNGADYSITFLSPQAQMMLEAPRALPGAEVFPWFVAHLVEADRERFAASVREAVVHQADWFFEGRFVKPSGAVIWIEGRSRPVQKNGQLYHHGLIQDVTMRKEAEQAFRESERKYHEMVNALPQIVYEVDVQGRVLFVNQAGNSVVGYSQADVAQGINFLQVIHPRDRERIKANLNRLIKGENISGQEYTAIRKDGQEFPVMAFSRPILRAGELVGFSGFLVDISERKQAEAKLRQAHDQLEQRVAERTAELAASYESLKALSRKQEMNIELAQQALALVNPPPPRHIALAGGQTLFVTAHYFPCYAEGGDHFFVRTDARGGAATRTMLSVKDQSGHEVGCILRSIMTDLMHTSLLLNEPDPEPGKIMERLNDEICASELFVEGDYFTAINADIHHDTLRMRYLSAGHPPLLLRRGGEVWRLPEDGQPGGNLPCGFSSGQKFVAAEIQLQPGDQLLFYTDGLLELAQRRGLANKTSKALHAWVASLAQAQPHSHVSDLLHTMLQRLLPIEQDSPPVRFTLSDDVALLALEIELPSPIIEERIFPASSEDLSRLTRELFARLCDEWREHGIHFSPRRLRLVLEEALLNAWKHGNQCNPAKAITIRRQYGNDARLEVLDEGAGFNLDAIYDPTSHENVLKPTGRGMFAIRLYASAVQWHAPGNHMDAYFARHGSVHQLAQPQSIKKNLNFWGSVGKV